ncbi:hypothetical protein CVT24_002847 [Panaeolus cyanescens]|uniref:Uncharacterized protein n=1 Tax=Panaeolus cyanescens TaxID=181874 RepID=A0A409XAH9_9AGAR|nr:hypothetical protein CVT24_002847 [Panaeolus cyanescens]
MFDACIKDAFQIKNVGVSYGNFMLAARYLRDLLSLIKGQMNGSLPSLLNEGWIPANGLTAQSSSRALWLAALVSPVFLFWGLDVSRWNVRAADLIKYFIDLMYTKPAPIAELDLLIWKSLFETALGQVHGTTGYLSAVSALDTVNVESCKDWFCTGKSFGS